MTTIETPSDLTESWDLYNLTSSGDGEKEDFTWAPIDNYTMDTGSGEGSGEDLMVTTEEPTPDLIEVQELNDRHATLVLNFAEDLYQQNWWYWYYYEAPEGFYGDLVWRGYDPTYAIKWLGWDAHWRALQENGVVEVVDA